MIKISQLVLDLINQDEVALEALRKGFLNLSAYALTIQDQLEKTLFKPVKKGSIVTALSRIQANQTDKTQLRPKVRLDDISIKSPLCEITYDKTNSTLDSIYKLRTGKKSNLFFSVTQGVGEISLIVHQSIKDEILNRFSSKAKGIYDNLVAVTIRFDENEYIEIPNMIYSLVSALAGKRINLIEIVSTYTEISFIVRQKDMKETVEIFKNSFLD